MFTTFVFICILYLYFIYAYIMYRYIYISTYVYIYSVLSTTVLPFSSTGIQKEEEKQTIILLL